MDPETELDLTNEHLDTLQGVELKSSLQYLDLTANRLRELDERILALPDLRFLSLRQNLLGSASAISGAACKGALKELLLNDNHITEIPDLSEFTAFTRLEFSYNQIRTLKPLELVDHGQLTDLYCAVNKVSAIESIGHLTRLTVLELGSNRIKEIEALETLTNLRELWLGRNRISAIVGISALTNLRQISLQANRLESMAGVGVLVGLEELYLSQNGIKEMEDLAALTALKVLDLAQNKIQRVAGLQNQTRLTDLWLNDNCIEDLDHLESALDTCKMTLTTVYLENNACTKIPAYLHIMKRMLPQLEFLDSVQTQR